MFHDLDQEIEQTAGKSIPDLFAGKGEAGFRELEKKRLDDLLCMGPEVIALAVVPCSTRKPACRLRRQGEWSAWVLRFPPCWSVCAANQVPPADRGR